MHFKTTFAIKYVRIQFFYRKAQNVKYNRHIIIYNQNAAHYIQRLAFVNAFVRQTNVDEHVVLIIMKNEIFGNFPE